MDSNELGEWHPDDNQWTRPFPPMSKHRYWPSATSYKHWLVVAGGSHSYRILNSVEVLNVDSLQWSIKPSTPAPWSHMKCAVIGNSWYIMGGFCSYGLVADVYSASLEALVSHSVSDTPNIWVTLSPVNYLKSCPLNVGGSLLAFGGKDKDGLNPVDGIQCYVPETNS